MMFTEFWDMVLNPVFVVMFGLVLLPFVPLLLSIYVTWKENSEQEEE